MQFIDLGNNKYRIETKAYGHREGSLRDVVEFAVFDLYVSYKEIERALVVMNGFGHDAAEFGIFGSFIFSYSTKEQKRVG